MRFPQFKDLERLNSSGVKWAAALAVAAVLALIITRLEWPKYRRLLAEGVGINGWVTAKDIVGRKTVDYSYQVDGRVYTGTGRPGFGNPEWEEISVGERVVVFYLPKDPGVSGLGDPKEHLRQQNFVILLALSIFCPLFFWTLTRELRRASA